MPLDAKSILDVIEAAGRADSATLKELPKSYNVGKSAILRLDL